MAEPITTLTCSLLLKEAKHKQACQRYYQKNKELIIQRAKDYYQENKEHVKEKRKLRYQKSKKQLE